jgi:hypothetical protein
MWNFFPLVTHALGHAAADIILTSVPTTYGPGCTGDPNPPVRWSMEGESRISYHQLRMWKWKAYIYVGVAWKPVRKGYARDGNLTTVVHMVLCIKQQHFWHRRGNIHTENHQKNKSFNFINGPGYPAQPKEERYPVLRALCTLVLSY